MYGMMTPLAMCLRSLVMMLMFPCVDGMVTCHGSPCFTWTYTPCVTRRACNRLLTVYGVAPLVKHNIYCLL